MSNLDRAARRNRLRGELQRILSEGVDINTHEVSRILEDDLPAALDLLDQQDRELERLREALREAVGEKLDAKHIIEFRADGWTIQHPLACRPNLFDCEVSRAASRDLDDPPERLGRFECDIQDGRFWWADEPIEAALSRTRRR